jgi:hypothetical protein
MSHTLKLILLAEVDKILLTFGEQLQNQNLIYLLQDLKFYLLQLLPSGFSELKKITTYFSVQKWIRVALTTQNAEEFNKENSKPGFHRANT